MSLANGLSWIVAIVSCVSLWRSGKNPRIGWMVGIPVQAVYVVLALLTHTYGGILMSVVFTLIYVRNLRGSRGKTFTEATEPAMVGEREKVPA